MMNSTGIVRDSRYLAHIPDKGHPENARRLSAVYELLDRERVCRRCPTIRPRFAEPEELLLVHAPEYIEKVAASENWDFGLLGPDTQVSTESYRTARLAVGGVLEAIRLVIEGRFRNVLALVRPPGHHAERSRAMGYCIFNNAAIGAAHARRRLGVERILLLDWDVHHGNGTQHFFERDPTVLFVSIHQYPHFPKTGFFTETGIGPGEGFTVNIPLPRGYGDGEYAALFERVVLPISLEFDPQLIVVSAGFDIHRSDPFGGMNVTEAGFAAMTRCLMEIAAHCCQGKMVLVLEGGYEPEALASSVRAVIDELSDRSRADLSKTAAQGHPKKIAYALNRCTRVHQRFWKSLKDRGGPR